MFSSVFIIIESGHPYNYLLHHLHTTYPVSHRHHIMDPPPSQRFGALSAHYYTTISNLCLMMDAGHDATLRRLPDGATTVNPIGPLLMCPPGQITDIDVSKHLPRVVIICIPELSLLPLRRFRIFPPCGSAVLLLGHLLFAYAMMDLGCPNLVLQGHNCSHSTTWACFSSSHRPRE